MAMPGLIESHSHLQKGYGEAADRAWLAFGIANVRGPTVTPAQKLNLNAGSIEAGKPADTVIVDGDPLKDIANARRVKSVIANGRFDSVDDVVKNVIHSDVARYAGCRFAFGSPLRSMLRS